MSLKIKSIKNFISTAQLDNSGLWYANNDSFLHGADVCIIRSITYVSTSATKAIYNVNCDFSRDPIGAVVNSPDGFVSNPQKEIKLNNPNLSQIRFWLTSVAVAISNAATDTISIEMDFITYES